MTTATEIRRIQEGLIPEDPPEKILRARGHLGYQQKVVSKQPPPKQQVKKPKPKREDDDEIDEDERARGVSKRETTRIKKYLMQSLRHGNATAGRLLLQLNGQLQDKPEEKHGITGDEIAKAQIQADKELKEWRSNRPPETGGMAQV